jgi:hypothetical protein
VRKPGHATGLAAASRGGSGSTGGRRRALASARKVAKPARALQHQRMHEGLRQIAAQLPLIDIKLLGVQARGSAGGPAALEEPDGPDDVALLQ